MNKIIKGNFVCGRALLIDKSENLYVSKGFSLFCSSDNGKSWKEIGKIKDSLLKSQLGRCSLSRRLLRLYISKIHVFDNKIILAVSRDGIYRIYNNSFSQKCFSFKQGKRPLNIGIGPKEEIVFGEYGRNNERKEIHIYYSKDYGSTFHKVFTFKAGDIRHVHNIIFDKYLNKYWVFVGDYDHEPGIALLDNDFSNLTWIRRGSQLVRVVNAIVKKDFIVFGTDTEIEQNYIVKLNKKSGLLTKLSKIDGSSLFATSNNRLGFISTAIEPSNLKLGKKSYLYHSQDLEDWTIYKSYIADKLPKKYFQYSTIVLAPNLSNNSNLLFSGQSLQNCRNVEYLKFF